MLTSGIEAQNTVSPTAQRNDDPARSAMEFLCDGIRDAMAAEHIRWDISANPVDMVLSSDLSDPRQKEKVSEGSWR